MAYASFVFVGVIAVLASSLVSASEPSALAGITAKHNVYRTEVGSPSLVWDDTVAAHAQSWASYLAANQSCNLIHGGHAGEGQNLAGGTTSLVDLDKSAALWYTEKPFYSGELVNSTNYVKFGHYTQMVWCSTTKVGCGIAYCGSSAIVACNYYPPGNYLGQRAFCGGAGGFGDPHIKTFGGMIVTYTGEGDVTLLEAPSVGLRYLNRFHAPIHAPASWTTAMALQCSTGAEVLELYARPSAEKDADIRINGQGLAWLEIDQEHIGSAVSVRRTGGGKYIVQCLDGALHLDVTIRRKQEDYAWMDIGVYPGAQLLNKAAGLLGSFDNDHTNDVAFSHGEVLELSEKVKSENYISFLDHGAIHEVEESWRVAPENTLFSDAHPAVKIGSKRALLEAAFNTFLSDHSARLLRARQLCTDAGLEGAFIHTCAYDLTVTGDEAHIGYHREVMQA